MDEEKLKEEKEKNSAKKTVKEEKIEGFVAHSQKLNNYLDKLKSFFRAAPPKRTFAILGIVIVAVALPAFVLIAQYQTRLEQHAAVTPGGGGGGCTDSYTYACQPGTTNYCQLHTHSDCTQVYYNCTQKCGYCNYYSSHTSTVCYNQQSCTATWNDCTGKIIGYSNCSYQCGQCSYSCCSTNTTNNGGPWCNNNQQLCHTISTSTCTTSVTYSNCDAQTPGVCGIPTPTPSQLGNPCTGTNGIAGHCETNSYCSGNGGVSSSSSVCAGYVCCTAQPTPTPTPTPKPAAPECGTGSASNGKCVFNVDFTCPQADYVQGTCTNEQFSCCSITPTPTPTPLPAGYSCTHTPDKNKANTVGSCTTISICNLNCSDCDLNNDCGGGKACCHNLTPDTPTPTPTKTPATGCTSNCGSEPPGPGNPPNNPPSNPTSVACQNGTDTTATLAVKLSGIGSGSFENTTPEHASLTGEVDVVKSDGTVFTKFNTVFKFDGNNFTATSVDFGTNLDCSISYKVKVRIPRYLTKFSNETFNVGNSNKLTFNPLAGDIWPLVKVNGVWVVQGDNVLNAQDYNIFFLCYNHKITDAIPVTDGSGITASCDVANIFDESSTSTVLGGEPYNLFLRGEIAACAANSGCQGD